MWFFPDPKFAWENCLCQTKCSYSFGPEGVSDMLSKHWDHPTVYPIILKQLITRGNISLIPKKATQKREKENL